MCTTFIILQGREKKKKGGGGGIPIILVRTSMYRKLSGEDIHIRGNSNNCLQAKEKWNGKIMVQEV